MEQMFNLLFTSLPILFYGIYDRDVGIDLIRKYPRIYSEGKNNKYFNSKIFFSWIISALWQSVILCMIPFSFVKYTGDFGMSESFWTSGAISFTAVIISVNFKLFSFQYQWHWFNYFIIFLSIFIYMLFALGISSDIEGSFFTWYKVFTEMLSTAVFYCGVVWLVVALALYECTLYGFWRAFYPTNEHIMQEADSILKAKTAAAEKDVQNSDVKPQPVQTVGREIELSPIVPL